MAFSDADILEAFIEDSGRGGQRRAEGAPAGHSWGLDSDYRELERVRKRAANLRWTRKNREKNAAKAKRWRANNPDKVAAYDANRGKLIDTGS